MLKRGLNELQSSSEFAQSEGENMMLEGCSNGGELVIMCDNSHMKQKWAVLILSSDLLS
jgi:hypothetical protein